MADKTASELVDDLKLDLRDVIRVYNQERILSPDASYVTYTTWEKNWLQIPPAVIRVNGVDISQNDYEIDYGQGTVTFESALGPTDSVTAEFYFQPISDTELSSFINRASTELANHISAPIDVNVIPDAYQVPIVDLAFHRAYHGIMAGTAGYHRWISNGIEINKDMVTRNYDIVLSRKREVIKTAIYYLRLGLMGGGTTVTPETTDVTEEGTGL